MDTMSKRKKVLSPIESGGENGKEKKTFWMRVGIAFVNRDGSINIHLDAMPKNMKLQVRDFDERDLQSRPRDDEHRNLAVADGLPF
jgi:hypothetical protein